MYLFLKLVLVVRCVCVRGGSIELMQQPPPPLLPPLLTNPPNRGATYLPFSAMHGVHTHHPPLS